MQKPNLLWEADRFGVIGPLPRNFDLGNMHRSSVELLLIDYFYNYKKLENYIEQLEGRIYELEEIIDGADLAGIG